MTLVVPIPYGNLGFRGTCHLHERVSGVDMPPRFHREKEDPAVQKKNLAPLKDPPMLKVPIRREKEVYRDPQSLNL